MLFDGSTLLAKDAFVYGGAITLERKFRIEDPAGLKKMRFILDYHSIELFINDGQQTATTAICTPLNAKNIYFFSDKKMTMSVEKHDIIM